MLVTALLAIVQADALFQGEVLYENRLLYVHATVNGSADRLFLIDTGANVSAIDTGVAKELGIEPKETTTVEGTAGTVTVQATILQEIALGEAKHKDLRVTMQDFSGFLRPQGTQVAGILGSDFMKQFVVRFDFRRKRIALFKTAPPKGIEAFELPMEMDNGIPRIVGRIKGLDVPLRIDTGASLFETRDVYVNVLEKTYEELGMETLSHLQGTGVGGALQLKVGRALSIAFGKLSLPKPYLIAQPPQGYFARPDAVGFVSNNLLEKCTPVTFDFPAKRLEINPPEAT